MTRLEMEANLKISAIVPVIQSQTEHKKMKWAGLAASKNNK